MVHMLPFLHNLFIPHSKNNYRSKLLHNTSLFALASLLLLSSFLFIFIKKEKPAVLGVSYSISVEELFSLTNQERVKQNLSPLTLNSKLSEAAAKKALHMLANNYWAHFAPDGTSPWYFIKNSGYNYTYAGENLAKGFTASSDVVAAWMKSPTHRENMVSPKYSDVGFAVVEGKLLGEDTVLVVEMFGSRPIITENAPSFAAPLPASQQVLAEPAVQEMRVQAPDIAKKSTEVKPTQPSSVYTNPLFDIHVTSKALAIVAFTSLFFALLLDIIIVERNKIPRIVGHNIDHILLILIFVYYILLEKSGGIL